MKQQGGPPQQTRWKGESGTGSIHFPRPCTQKTWKGGDEWVHSVLEGKSETRPLFCAWLGSKRQGPAGAADTQPVASRGSPGRGPGSPGLRGRAAPPGPACARRRRPGPRDCASCSRRGRGACSCQADRGAQPLPPPQSLLLRPQSPSPARPTERTAGFTSHRSVFLFPRFVLPLEQKVKT